MTACILTGIVGLVIGVVGAWFHLSVTVVGEALDEGRVQ